MKSSKSLFCIAMACMVSAMARSLSEEELGGIARKMAVAKAAEAPSVELSLVLAQAQENRLAAANAAFAAGLKANPSAVASLLAPLLRAVPGSAESLARVALDQSTDNAVVVIRLVAELQPDQASAVLAVAIEKVPAKARQFRHELLAVQRQIRRSFTNDFSPLDQRSLIIPLVTLPNPYGSVSP